jgi:hypothetical protein
MTGDLDFDFKEELKDDFQNYFNTENTSDFSNYFPSTNQGFIISTSLNIPGIYNHKLDDPIVKDALDGLLSRQGISTDELFRTFGGDMAVASYRDNAYEKASLLFATKYYNKGLLNKFLQLGEKSEYLIKETPQLYKVTATQQDSSAFNITFPDGYPRIFLTDEILFYITNANHYNRISRGGYRRSERIDSKMQEVLNSNMIAGHFDMDVMVNEPGKKSLFEDCDFSFDDEGMAFKLNFKNKNISALKQLIERQKQENQSTD